MIMKQKQLKTINETLLGSSNSTIISATAAILPTGQHFQTDAIQLRK